MMQGPDSILQYVMRGSNVLPGNIPGMPSMLQMVLGSLAQQQAQTDWAGRTVDKGFVPPAPGISPAATPTSSAPAAGDTPFMGGASMPTGWDARQLEWLLRNANNRFLPGGASMFGGGQGDMWGYR